jgi:hypothetical protein
VTTIAAPTAAELETRDFTFTIETAPGTVSGSDEFERFADVVYGDERFLNAALGLDTETGAVSFTFNVRAESLAAANELALLMVAEAIAAHRDADTRRKVAKAILVGAALLLIVRIAGELDVDVEVPA